MRLAILAVLVSAAASAAASTAPPPDFKPGLWELTSTASMVGDGSALPLGKPETTRRCMTAQQMENDLMHGLRNVPPDCKLTIHAKGSQQVHFSQRCLTVEFNYDNPFEEKRTEIRTDLDQDIRFGGESLRVDATSSSGRGAGSTPIVMRVRIEGRHLGACPAG